MDIRSRRRGRDSVETGARLRYSPLLKTFAEARPDAPRGGVLAEEMGLGKTVITLAVILDNPAPANALPAAWGGDADRVRTRATLVVCPVSLVSQWHDEAVEKVPNGELKVYQYYGGNRVTDPAKLADYDVIITTYQILVSDLNARTAAAKKAKQAAEKAGEPYLPPLARLNFWRVVLDESHVIKEENTAMARAVCQLSANRRWSASNSTTVWPGPEGHDADRPRGT